MFCPCEVIKNYGKDIITAMMHASNVMAQPRTEIFMRWEPPLENWIKLNVDGASKGNPGLAGGGGALRTHKGDWIKGFAANFGICSSVKAEMLAVLQGLWLAWNLGILRLELHMDSKVMVDTLTGATKNYFIVKNCKELLHDLRWSIKLSHCYRKSNRVANRLANLGIGQSTPIVIFETPSHSWLYLT